jgi:hypothetical protein
MANPILKNNDKKPVLNSGQKKAVNIPINTVFTPDVFNRMTVMTKDKGLIEIQNLIRLAVSKLLTDSGY